MKSIINHTPDHAFTIQSFQKEALFPLLNLKPFDGLTNNTKSTIDHRKRNFGITKGKINFCL